MKWYGHELSQRTPATVVGHSKKETKGTNSQDIRSETTDKKKKENTHTKTNNAPSVNETRFRCR